MKNYTHIAERLYNEPWLITPEKHATLVRLFEAFTQGPSAGFFDSKDDNEPDESEPRLNGSTLIIPVHGVLGKHLSGLEMMCGGCSMDAIGQSIDAADKNYQCQSILLDFRSPGGTVVGTPELGKKISSANKDVYAFTDYECCSGALWLASQCQGFYCTESAMVGSVGVYSIYTDRTKQLDEAGIKVNAISAGEYKLSGAPFRKMSDDERAMLQSQIDGMHERFKAAITSNRDVSDEYLQGQVFEGHEAAQYGFVDGLVDDLDGVLEMLR